MESESKSNSVDRFQYFQTNREDILDVINTVTIQLSNTLKENFKNGVKKTLRSFTENCRGKQAVLATTETQVFQRILRQTPLRARVKRQVKSRS